MPTPLLCYRDNGNPKTHRLLGYVDNEVKVIWELESIRQCYDKIYEYNLDNNKDPGVTYDIEVIK